jgi:hypothetical protein
MICGVKSLTMMSQPNSHRVRLLVQIGWKQWPQSRTLRSAAFFLLDPSSPVFIRVPDIFVPFAWEELVAKRARWNRDQGPGVRGQGSAQTFYRFAQSIALLVLSPCSFYHCVRSIIPHSGICSITPLTRSSFEMQGSGIREQRGWI